MINIQQYIESGVIEEYVVGNLTMAEALEVEKLATIYPEIAKELESIAISLSMFDKLSAKVPPTYMQNKIWDNVNVSESPISADIKPHILKNKSYTWANYMGVAAFALIAFLGIFWGVKANNQLEKIEKEIVSIKKDNSDLNSSITILKESISSNNSIYKLPNIKVVVLEGSNRKNPDGLALVIWDKNKNEVYLDIKNLQVNLSDDNYYCLWAISQIGQQNKVGRFDYSGQNEIIKIGNAYDCIQFKVSQEKNDDVTRPTLAKVLLKGNVNY